VSFLEHFGFIEQPFGVTPDSRFLHLGPKHREALASLVRATEENRGFVALIALPGMGKTSLLFHYLEGLRNKARTAFIFQRPRNAPELMRYLLADLGISDPARDLPQMNQTLNGVLTEEMRAGRRFVLVIDEAQNLGDSLLESVRLLSNFETPWVKLIHIVLAGQPQLAERLAQPPMMQLRQRISSFIGIEPFDVEETCAYIDHRLWVAGYAGPSLFTAGARILIAEQSGGIPRNISNLCYHSLALAHATGEKQVKAEIVREAIFDLAVESIASSYEERMRTKPVLEWHSSKTTSVCQASRMLSPLGSPSSARKASFAALFLTAVLLLSIVSGVLWKATPHPQRLGDPPVVEAATFPARPPALAPMPETMSPPPNGPAANPTAEQKRKARELTVVVENGETLRHICLQNLGRFDPAVLSSILSRNPEIKDPDRIEARQRIRLPLDLPATAVTWTGEATAARLVRNREAIP